MNPLKFPEANTELAKSQPQFRVLPVCIAEVSPPDWPTDEPRLCEYTCKYELSELEIEQMIRLRSFYITQTGTGFHPIYPQIPNAWMQLNIEYKRVGETWYAYVPREAGKFDEVAGFSPKSLLDNLLSMYHNLTADNINFVEKALFGVNEKGDIVGI